MGYVIFVLLVLVGSGIVAGVLGRLFGMRYQLALLRVRSPVVRLVLAAILGGVTWGVVFFVFMAITASVFPKTRVSILAGISAAFMLISSPKVRNAAVVVPTAIITVLALSLLL